MGKCSLMMMMMMIYSIEVFHTILQEGNYLPEISVLLFIVPEIPTENLSENIRYSPGKCGINQLDAIVKVGIHVRLCTVRSA